MGLKNHAQLIVRGREANMAMITILIDLRWKNYGEPQNVIGRKCSYDKIYVDHATRTVIRVTKVSFD